MKRKAEPDPMKNTCKLLVVADHRFYKYMGRGEESTTTNYLVSVGGAPPACGCLAALSPVGKTLFCCGSNTLYIMGFLYLVGAVMMSSVCTNEPCNSISFKEP